MKDDFRDRSHLTVHDGDRPGDKPRRVRRRNLRQSEQVTCSRCLRDTGVETSAVVEITLAPRRDPDGKPTDGTRVHVCAHCLARGVITELF